MADDSRLTPSEIITPALFAQWNHSSSERSFYRYACHHLRPAFSPLSYPGQLNRQITQRYCGAMGALSRYLVALLQAVDGPYAALVTGASRDAKGAALVVGWWAQADIGWSNRLSWYE